MAARKQYSQEFNLDAVSLVTEQGCSRAQAARSLQTNANMLGRWIQEATQGAGQAFRSNGKMTKEQQQIRELQSQVKRLKMEKLNRLGYA